MGPLLVVVDEPAFELGPGLLEALEVIGPHSLLLVGLEHALDEGVAVGVAIGGPAERDAEVVGHLPEVVRGELGPVVVAQGDLVAALAEYQKALTVNPSSSLASYRIGELLFTQKNYQASVNAYRDALRGDDDPAWTEVWSHIAIGKIFDLTGQRDRAVNEYRLAVQTNDNTQGAVNEARLYLQKPFTRPDNE